MRAGAALLYPETGYPHTNLGVRARLVEIAGAIVEALQTVAIVLFDEPRRDREVLRSEFSHILWKTKINCRVNVRSGSEAPSSPR
jgi:hypothetical protein